jgi:CDP-6-deoxy-D-xylo-4-hexulose-3-dehydrase
LRAHGWTRELPEGSNWKNVSGSDWFDSQFEFVLPGLNFRPLEMEGALGNAQLEKHDEMLRIRRTNASAFKEIISKFDWIKTQEPIGDSSWFAFAMILESNSVRSSLTNFLRELKVETRPIVAGNFTNQKVMNFLPHEILGPLSNSEVLDSRGFYIGNHPVDLVSKLEQIGKALTSFQNRL